MAAEHTVRLGGRIRAERKAKGLTQRELAEAIPGKADSGQVSKWERGKNRPGDDTLEHIAKALSIDVAALYAPAPESNETADLMGTLNGSQLDRIERMLKEVLDRLPKRALSTAMRGSPAAPAAAPKELPSPPRRASGRRKAQAGRTGS